MRKRILLLYDFFSEHGGIERIMLFQAETLKKEGYDVVFGYSYVDEKLKKEKLKGFKVIEYDKLPIKNETLQISLSIFKQNIKKFKKFDLIICHSFPSSYLARRINKKFNIPYILHLHHPPQFLYNVNKDWTKSSFKRNFAYNVGKILNFPLKKFDNYCVQNANDYILECKTVEKIIKNTYKINGVVSYPTYNHKFKKGKFSRSDVSKFGIKKDFVLGSGRIIPQKRFDFLIRAFSYLKEKNLQLVLVGKYDFDEKERLEKLSLKCNIEVLFLGPVDLSDLIKLYNLAKVTVLTCPKEWFGLVPIESIACGCPVVSWKDGFGPEETILPEINGFLAEPYNVLDLSKKMRLSLNKKWDKKKIVQSVEKFSEKNISKIFLNKIKEFI